MKVHHHFLLDVCNFGGVVFGKGGRDFSVLSEFIILMLEHKHVDLFCDVVISGAA